jgi:hypothetical protein
MVCLGGLKASFLGSRRAKADWNHPSPSPAGAVVQRDDF